MHGCLGPAGVCRSSGVSVACYCSPKSLLMESVAEGCVGVLLFPAALLLPLLSNTFTIRNPGAGLEFWNLGGICWRAGPF